MPTYTGPVPPAPPANTATDAQWQAWWSYQNILRDLRYEDERTSRAVVTDRQHVEKLQAEANCAAAQREAAASQLAMASALRYAAELDLQRADMKSVWTDEDLVRQWMTAIAEGGATGVVALSKARSSLLAFRLLYPAPPIPAPAPKPPVATTAMEAPI